MKLYRDYCCDCGRRESLWSAIKREVRRRFTKSTPPDTYQGYWDRRLLEVCVQTLVTNQLAQPKPFPANAGSNTIRFLKTSE